MNQNALNRRALAVVGRVLSRNAGVTLRIEGSAAKTDGKTITIPDLGERLDEKRLELATGYLYHEAGHCRHTDFGIVADPEMPPETRDMLNLLEDIAVEARMGREYAGCLETLTTLNERMLEARPDPLSSLLLNGMKDTAGQPLAKTPDPRLARDSFGEDVFERVAEACGPDGSTADRLALAQSLVDALTEQVDALIEQEWREMWTDVGRELNLLAGDGNGGEEGETGTAAGQGNRGEGASSGKDGAGLAAKKLLEALREYQGLGERLAGMLAAEHEKAQKEAREAKTPAGAAGGAGGRLPASLAAGAEGPVRALPAPEADAAGYFRLRDRHARLGERFIRLFQSERDEAWVDGLDRGTIDGRALWKIRTGQFRVFKERRRTPRIAHETAVSLLVDCSGSMDGERLENAMAAAALFLESLARADVACEVLGFTTEIVRSRDGYADGGPLAYEIKRFAEPLASAVRRRVAGYGKIDLGGTNIVDPLLLAYHRLARRPEPRRMLFVLTDGEEGGRGEEELARVARAIEAEGLVELLAIDLMSGHTRGLFSRRIVVDSSEQLPKQMMAGLERCLLASRRPHKRAA